MRRRLLALLCAPALFGALPGRIPVTPIAFEPNTGQLSEAPVDAKFLAHTSQATLWIKDRGVGIGGFSIRFAGARPNPDIEPEDRQPGFSNYFIGNDRSKWRTHVPHYSKLRYRDIYPGIDAVFYGNQDALEYDFVLRAGADPSRITLAFDGASSLVVDHGDLVAITAGGAQVRNLRPAVFQGANASVAAGSCAAAAPLAS